MFMSSSSIPVARGYIAGMSGTSMLFSPVERSGIILRIRSVIMGFFAIADPRYGGPNVKIIAVSLGSLG